MKNIGYTLANNLIPYLQITSQTDGQHKKVIALLARQHPGETSSSFLMESIIYALVKAETNFSKWLLANYTFAIFPMVNVDGVIYGNFRCDLSGMDLNRLWKNPSSILHPHICKIKEEIKQLRGRIECCFDLHGHSKQFNIFGYCCKT